MSILTAVLIVLVILVMAVAVYELWLIRSLRVVEAPEPIPAESHTDPTEWIQAVLRKRIIVHTKDNQSLEGSLSDTMEDGLVLRAATLLNSEGPATTMAGEVFVPRVNVAFAQLDE